MPVDARRFVRRPCPCPAHRRDAAAAPSKACTPGRSRSSTAHGRLLYAAGDPESLTFTRSALKPLQALPFVAAGGVERFGYTMPQVGAAVREPLRRTAACRGGRGHAGQGRQHGGATCNAARTRRCSSTRAARCRRRRRIRRSRTTARASTAGCSRTASRAATASTTTSPSAIRCSRRSGARSRHSPTCRRRRSSPASTAARRRTTRCRSRRLALAFARLAAADVDDAVYGRAPRTLADAMTAHPEMVSGERRSDLALARAGRGDWVCKIGAEGVQAIGIRSRGWGIAIKVADGNAPRAAPGDGRRARPAGPARRRRARQRWRRGRSPTLRNYRGHRHRRGASRRCPGQNQTGR